MNIFRLLIALLVTVIFTTSVLPQEAAPKKKLTQQERVLRKQHRDQKIKEGKSPAARAMKKRQKPGKEGAWERELAKKDSLKKLNK